MPEIVNYTCEECFEGTVLKITVQNYKAKIEGRDFVVPEAVIGVCNKCEAKHFDIKETKRWANLYHALERAIRNILAPCLVYNATVDNYAAIEQCIPELIFLITAQSHTPQ